HRHTHRHTDTDTHRHTHRDTHRHRHRHALTHTHPHTHTHTQCVCEYVYVCASQCVCVRLKQWHTSPLGNPVQSLCATVHGLGFGPPASHPAMSLFRISPHSSTCIKTHSSASVCCSPWVCVCGCVAV